MPLPRWIRRKSVVAAGVVLALIAGYLVTCAVMDPRVPVGRARLERAMTAAADYLQAKTLDSGRYVYEVDGAGAEHGKRYNVLRHAGTIYSLSMYYELRPSPALRDAILRAARYLRDRHVFSVSGVDGASTVFSLPGEESGAQRSAKLGGAGLGLVALIRARRLDEQLIPVERLREIARFILFMQRSDGSFRSKYSERVAFAEDFDSLYYPGEAILALVSLYDIDRDPRWLDAALRATRSLVDRQRAMSKLPNDHWLMIAIAELARFHGDAREPAIGRDDMLAHAVAVGDGMLAEQRWTRLVPGATGSFLPDARTTPSSTRLEGLVALYLALPAGHGARERLREAIERGTGFILACQEQGGPNAGGFRKALRGRFGGADWRHVRIDYVQHALSALIGYARIAYPE